MAEPADACFRRLDDSAIQELLVRSAALRQANLVRDVMWRRLLYKKRVCRVGRDVSWRPETSRAFTLCAAGQEFARHGTLKKRQRPLSGNTSHVSPVRTVSVHCCHNCYSAHALEVIFSGRSGLNSLTTINLIVLRCLVYGYPVDHLVLLQAIRNPECSPQDHNKSSK